MKSYWPAECLAVSYRPYSYFEVRNIAGTAGLLPSRMGIKKYVTHGVDVYRLFHVPVQYRCCVEAYAAAGATGKRIAVDGPKVKGMGMVVVLDDFVRPYLGMETHNDWN